MTDEEKNETLPDPVAVEEQEETTTEEERMAWAAEAAERENAEAQYPEGD